SGDFTYGTTLHYRYDIVNDTWEARAPLHEPTFGAAAGAVGNRIILFGGLANVYNITGYNTSYVYDTLSDSWMSGSDMNLPNGYTAGTAIGNRLIVVGGDINTGDSTVETARVSTTGCVTPTATATPVSCVLGFAPATDFPAGTGPRSVAAGDFNRDSNADLVIANTDSNNVS